ncbi:MAG: hypothetical protein RSB76_03025 [Clostridia bacterium]
MGKHYRKLYLNDPFEGFAPSAYEIRLAGVKQKSEKKLSKRETVIELKRLRNYCTKYCYNEVADIFNLILQNPRYISKVTFCSDGSYLSNWLWYFPCYDYCISIVNNKFNDFTGISIEPQMAKDKLIEIFRNYSVIFIQPLKSVIESRKIG